MVGASSQAPGYDEDATNGRAVSEATRGQGGRMSDGFDAFVADMRLGELTPDNRRRLGGVPCLLAHP